MKRTSGEDKTKQEEKMAAVPTKVTHWFLPLAVLANAAVVATSLSHELWGEQNTTFEDEEVYVGRSGTLIKGLALTHGGLVCVSEGLLCLLKHNK